MHTPGPWEIAFGGMPQDDYAVIGSPHSDRPICNLEPRDYNPANARLIAAAPTLLEALEVMTSLCRIKYGNLDKDVYAEIVKAEAAIAAARGEVTK